MTEGSAPNDEAGLRGLKVLIVEDEAVVAFDLEYVLRDLGCVPLPPAASVADALGIVAAERPDVVLLDVRLADGSAAPLAIHLDGLAIPYIVVTGYDEAQVEPPLRGAPRLAKPYRLGQLKAALLAIAARGG